MPPVNFTRYFLQKRPAGRPFASGIICFFRGQKRTNCLRTKGKKPGPDSIHGAKKDRQATRKHRGSAGFFVEAEENIIRSIGELGIIGYTDDYLGAIINEVSTDNMGVDFAQPAQKKPVESIPKEKQEEQQEEFDDIESGMQSARTMICPHCGKEITL